VLSVCLSVTFVHCAKTAKDIEKISFVYDSPMSLPDRVKIWLTSVNPFFSKFCFKVTQCWFECRYSATFDGKTAAEWLEIAQWSQWTAYRIPPSLFRMIPSLTHDIPFPKWRIPNTQLTRPTSQRLLPPGEYDRIYREGSCALCRMSLWAKWCRLCQATLARPCYQLLGLLDSNTTIPHILSKWRSITIKIQDRHAWNLR